MGFRVSILRFRVSCLGAQSLGDLQLSEKTKCEGFHGAFFSHTGSVEKVQVGCAGLVIRTTRRRRKDPGKTIRGLTCWWLEARRKIDVSLGLVANQRI